MKLLIIAFVLSLFYVSFSGASEVLNYKGGLLNDTYKVDPDKYLVTYSKDRVSKASDCKSVKELNCFISFGIKFAVPENYGLNQTEWSVFGVAYKVIYKFAEFEIMSKKIKNVDVIEAKVKLQEHSYGQLFYYSPRHGLLGFTAIGKEGEFFEERTFWLERGEGLFSKSKQ